ncbi:MAG TPA: hypothetical protein VN541_14935 [Tepidisphaeraceae bacterium]|nr:hypothetical protein [Tepidisphaeraceae bacterium]
MPEQVSRHVPPTVSYATPAPVEPPAGYVRIATYCGAVPLLVGCLAFVLWTVTRSSIWSLVGLLTIAFGLVLFLIGNLFLLMYLLRLPSRDRFHVFLRTSWKALFLLPLNFPVCIAFILAYSYIISLIPVTVRNTSHSIVSDVTITTPSGEAIRYGKLQPSSSDQRLIRKREGQFLLSATRGGQPVFRVLHRFYDKDDQAGVHSLTVDITDSGVATTEND